MEIVTTKELLGKLKEGPPFGFEVSARCGILNVTRCIFKRKGLIFYFDISEDFDFKKSNGQKKEEFLKKYEKRWWRIDMEL